MKQEELIQEDWNLLIILDACRYDVFKDVIDDYDIDGELIEAESFTYATPNFYGELPEYIDVEEIELFTANAVPFEHYDYSWKKSKLLDSIDPNKNLHEVSVDIVRGGDKKVLHLVPPHLPWISGEGKEIIKEMGLDPTNFPYTIRDKPYEEFVYSKVDNPMKYYEENLRYALRVLENRIPPLNDVVITSDHSESLREGAYCHIQGSVPWMEVEW